MYLYLQRTNKRFEPTWRSRHLGLALIPLGSAVAPALAHGPAIQFDVQKNLGAGFVAYGPGGGGEIVFGVCPTPAPPAVLRVHVELQHTPETGRDCADCQNTITEAGTRNVTVEIINASNGMVVATQTATWSCATPRVPPPGNPPEYTNDFDFDLTCGKDPDNPTACRLSVGGNTHSSNTLSFHVKVTVEYCKRRESICRQGRFRNNACTLDWADVASKFEITGAARRVRCPIDP